MTEQLRFYFSHSFNDLRVNGQRTLFALLAIGAGVAAIVSLQTLAILIEDTLTGNLQQQNRSDIQISPPFFIFEEGEQNDNPFGPPDDESSSTGETGADGEEDDDLDNFGIERTVADDVIERGFLVERTSNSLFGSNSQIGFSDVGLDAIRDLIDETVAGATVVTPRAALISPENVFLGTGTGTSMTDVDTDNQAIRLSPIVIDADVYPLYDEVRTLDGQTLAEAIQSPTDIVISEIAADTLEAEIGDQVNISGANEVFTVQGIVRVEAEASGIFSNPFIGLFGFYYIDLDALPSFETVEPLYDLIYVQLPEEAVVADVEQALGNEFSFIRMTTTDDLLEQNQQIADTIDTLVTAMGLISLLLGSIGILNTMQVVVRRRTTEIAVLKTLGLQANQVTILFLTEAFIMGVLGSLLGVVIGWIATFALRGIADVFTGQELAFRFALEPVLNGVIVGTLVTTVFGFIPTLSAGQVRPGTVLRPSQEIIPRAGIIRTLLSIIFIIIVVSLIARSILGGDLATAFLVVGGSFVAAGFLLGLLLLIIWLVGRFLPSFGLVDLKIPLRQMLVTRGRGAITLLALVVGVFALSLITLFTESFTNLLDFAIEEGAPGNVLVQGLPGTQQRIYSELDALTEAGTINGYYIDRSYEVTLTEIEKASTGETYTQEAFFQALLDGEINIDSSETDSFGSISINTISAPTVEQLDNDNDELLAGRFLTPEDAEEQNIVIRQRTTVDTVGLEVGDRLTFEIAGGGNLMGGGDTDTTRTVTFTLVGIIAQPTDEVTISFADNAAATALLESFPEEITPSSTIIYADSPEEGVPELRRAITAIPGAFVLELSLFSDLINLLVDQFQAFPTLVALLGLAVGGVVIANSVALATIERRREIAVMKSIGLQRERVLGMLLVENSILGIIGGLLGVGIGLLGLTIFSAQLELPSETIPFSTALLLMLLCVGVAVIAALTTAWQAAGEKPLNVLRYE